MAASDLSVDSVIKQFDVIAAEFPLKEAVSVPKPAKKKKRSLAGSFSDVASSVGNVASAFVSSPIPSRFRSFSSSNVSSKGAIPEKTEEERNAAKRQLTELLWETLAGHIQHPTENDDRQEMMQTLVHEYYARLAKISGKLHFKEMEAADFQTTFKVLEEYTADKKYNRIFGLLLCPRATQGTRLPLPNSSLEEKRKNDKERITEDLWKALNGIKHFPEDQNARENVKELVKQYYTHLAQFSGKQNLEDLDINDLHPVLEHFKKHTQDEKFEYIHAMLLYADTFLCREGWLRQNGLLSNRLFFEMFWQPDVLEQNGYGFKTIKEGNFENVKVRTILILTTALCNDEVKQRFLSLIVKGEYTWVNFRTGLEESIHKMLFAESSYLFAKKTKANSFEKLNISSDEAGSITDAVAGLLFRSEAELQECAKKVFYSLPSSSSLPISSHSSHSVTAHTHRLTPPEIDDNPSSDRSDSPTKTNSDILAQTPPSSPLASLEIYEAHPDTDSSKSTTPDNSDKDESTDDLTDASHDGFSLDEDNGNHSNPLPRASIDPKEHYELIELNSGQFDFEDIDSDPTPTAIESAVHSGKQTSIGLHKLTVLDHYKSDSDATDNDGPFDPNASEMGSPLLTANPRRADDQPSSPRTLTDVGPLHSAPIPLTSKPPSSISSDLPTSTLVSAPAVVSAASPEKKEISKSEQGDPRSENDDEASTLSLELFFPRSPERSSQIEPTSSSSLSTGLTKGDSHKSVKSPSKERSSVGTLDLSNSEYLSDNDEEIKVTKTPAKENKSTNSKKKNVSSQRTLTAPSLLGFGPNSPTHSSKGKIAAAHTSSKEKSKYDPDANLTPKTVGKDKDEGPKDKPASQNKVDEGIPQDRKISSSSSLRSWLGTSFKSVLAKFSNSSKTEGDVTSSAEVQPDSETFDLIDLDYHSSDDEKDKTVKSEIVAEHTDSDKDKVSSQPDVVAADDKSEIDDSFNDGPDTEEDDIFLLDTLPQNIGIGDDKGFTEPALPHSTASSPIPTFLQYSPPHISKNPKIIDDHSSADPSSKASESSKPKDIPSASSGSFITRSLSSKPKPLSHSFSVISTELSGSPVSGKVEEKESHSSSPLSRVSLEDYTPKVFPHYDRATTSPSIPSRPRSGSLGSSTEPTPLPSTTSSSTPRATLRRSQSFTTSNFPIEVYSKVDGAEKRDAALSLGSPIVAPSASLISIDTPSKPSLNPAPPAKRMVKKPGSPAPFVVLSLDDPETNPPPTSSPSLLSNPLKFIHSLSRKAKESRKGDKKPNPLAISTVTPLTSIAPAHPVTTHTPFSTPQPTPRSFTAMSKTLRHKEDKHDSPYSTPKRAVTSLKSSATSSKTSFFSSFSLLSPSTSESTSSALHNPVASSSVLYEDMLAYLRACVLSQNEVGGKEEESSIQAAAINLLASYKTVKGPNSRSIRQIMQEKLPQQYIDPTDGCTVTVEELDAIDDTGAQMIFTKTEGSGKKTKTAFIETENSTTKVEVLGEDTQAVRATVAAAEKLCTVSRSNVFVFEVDLSKASQKDQDDPAQVEAVYCDALLDANIVPVFLCHEKVNSRTAIWETYKNLCEDNSSNTAERYLETILGGKNRSLKRELITAFLYELREPSSSVRTLDREPYTIDNLLKRENAPLAKKLIEKHMDRNQSKKFDGNSPTFFSPSSPVDPTSPPVDPTSPSVDPTSPSVDPTSPLDPTRPPESRPPVFLLPSSSFNK